MARPKTKTEIDRDLLYSKIMPSASLSEQPFSEEALELPQIPLTPDNFAPPRTAGGVQMPDKDQTLVINLMERLVLERVDEVFSKFRCCKCDRCRKDVVALALNKLSPKYMVLSQEGLDSTLKRLNTTDVATALVQSIITVRAKPRH